MVNERQGPTPAGRDPADARTELAHLEVGPILSQFLPRGLVDYTR